MKLRMVPYGYKMNNGKIIPDKNEATVVRNIFDLYIGGKGLKAIADSLTAENMPIFEGNTIWSKNRIKRILENERYIGANSYPPILSDDLFVRAKKVSEEKGFTVEPCSPLIGFLKRRVLCEQCGKRYRRLQQARLRGRWNCIGGCTGKKSVTDYKLLKQIEKILNCVYRNKELLLVEKGKVLFEKTPQIIRYANEIGRMIDAPQPSFSATKNMILESVAVKFRSCREYRFPVYTDHVVKAFGNVDENDLMTVSFISDVVDAVLINNEGEVTIRFVNDTEVGIAEVKLCMSRHKQRKS